MVLNSDDFCSHDVYLEAVKSRIFNDPEYFVFCVQGNFLYGINEKGCLNITCASCDRLPECIHSCYAKLLWRMFEENQFIRPDLEEMVNTTLDK